MALSAKKKKQVEDANVTPISSGRRVIELPPIIEDVVVAHLRGISPLILNPFTAKAVQQMLDKQKGGSALRTPKDVNAEVEKRIQRLDDGRIGINIISFKKSMISASALVKGVKSTNVKQGVFMDPDGYDEVQTPLVGLTCSDPEPFIAHVRNATGVADVRVRPMLKDWSLQLRMILQIHAISIETAVNLLRLAGRGCGVGDWRPERTGVYGRFEIERVEVTTTTV